MAGRGRRACSNVPAHGRALLVSNHAGSLFPFDASMMPVAIMKEHPLPRWPRFMVLDWAFVLPFLSAFMRRVGGVPASPHNAARLLEQDELVMVFPEGVKGTGKPFSERYRLQRFGRGGFVEVALRTGAPIVPVAVVGLGGDLPEARRQPGRSRGRTGAPFVPITPTFPWLGPLGLVPLPSKWRIEFCEPIDLSAYGPDAADDRAPRVRPLRAGARDDPGEALREPGQAAARRSSGALVAIASSRDGRRGPDSASASAAAAEFRAPLDEVLAETRRRRSRRPGSLRAAGLRMRLRVPGPRPDPQRRRERGARPSP